MTPFQPNVAALLNNAYALPMFVSAAILLEGKDLGISDFAGKVLLAVYTCCSPSSLRLRTGFVDAVGGSRAVVCGWTLP